MIDFYVIYIGRCFLASQFEVVSVLRYSRYLRGFTDYLACVVVKNCELPATRMDAPLDLHNNLLVRFVPKEHAVLLVRRRIIRGIILTFLGGSYVDLSYNN